nr:hypothetical protein [Actinomycetes bacterium]
MTVPGIDRPAELLRIAVDTMLEPLTILESVRDSSGEIVDFRWLYINEAEATLLPRETMIGSCLLALLPEHRGGLFEAYKQVVDSGEKLVLSEVGYDDTWGTSETIPMVLNIQAVKVGDGVAVSWTDVTQGVAARHSLAAALRPTAHGTRQSKSVGFGVAA